MSWMVINIKLFSRVEAISLFRLRTSVRSLILSPMESTFGVLHEDKLKRMWKENSRGVLKFIGPCIILIVE